MPSTSPGPLKPADSALRVVVADDEPLAREGLRLAVEACWPPPACFVITCADGGETVEVLSRESIDVLLLDIDMPVLDGFAVLDHLEPEQVPAAVVFVTAFDEHAIRAFEVRALDYLLKPVPGDRLTAALVRAEQRVREARLLERQRTSEVDGQDRDADRQLEPPSGARNRAVLKRILVRDRGRTTVVLADDIEWIEADAYYVHLHTSAGAHMLRERMSILEAQLDPVQFVRTHRSAIVRVDRVRAVRAVSRYEHEVLLASGARVPLSRERRGRLEMFLAARGES